MPHPYAQACGFNDNRDAITRAGFNIYGLSADSPEEQAAWKAMHDYQYPLLCDPEFKACIGNCWGMEGSHKGPADSLAGG